MKTYLPLIGLAVILLFGLGGWRYYLVAQDLKLTQEQLAATTAELATTTAQLAQARSENVELNNQLQNEKSERTNLFNQVSQISGTVGTLEKLSKTDKELLRKYSKVYFLNENYVPPKLTEIDSKYVYLKERLQQIHTNVAPFLEDLLAAAATDDITLQIISAYRSFGTQASLKSNYKFTYGAGTANQFSADQGYSEHQLGTTVDFTTAEIGSILSDFEKTTAYTWLGNNGYKYGFILSYPKGNAYYKFEPWHWRFVGTDLARQLHRDGKYFYDLDQREIDKYLVSIFD